MSLLALALSFLAGGCTSDAADQAAAPQRAALGLNTSLPLYWAETGDLGELLDDSAAPHRVRALLETQYAPVLMDGFSDPELAGTPSRQMASLDFIVLAQPNALPPADLVAIDTWVRNGGKALVFADPMLTEDSAFAFGDRRRPLDIAMLGPLLTRWGLALDADASEEPGAHRFDEGVQAVTLRSGRFSAVPTEADATDCRVSGDGMLAQCTIGAGRAVLFADAAILQAIPPGESKDADAALRALMALAFAPKTTAGKDG